MFRKFALMTIGGAVGIAVAEYQIRLERKNAHLVQLVHTMETQRDFARNDVQRFKEWGTTMGNALEEMGRTDLIPMVDWSY